MKKIIIAIDGYSGCGKSTLARQLAAALHYIYIDTGAMYRALTFYFIKNKTPFYDEEALPDVLKDISLSFRRDPVTGKEEMVLNEEAIEQSIRTMEVTGKVSEVAAIPAIRKFAVDVQRKMGAAKGVVMDGRDIGTVVFPEAELKIFLTADPDIRVERRFLELQQKDPSITREKVKASLEQRDYADSHRPDSPLRQAADAIVIDNSCLTPEQQLQKALQLAKERMV